MTAISARIGASGVVERMTRRHRLTLPPIT
jgi:hypothetical protein